jgi:hypothetical protein
VPQRKPKPLPDKTVDIDRLCLAMNRSRLMLKRFREERREMVRQYVGQHWSEEGTGEKVTVNLISLYVSVVGRNLIAKNPRVMLSTFDRQNKPAVSAMQTWCNSEIVRMKLQNTMKRVVLDGLFSLGICKVALATPADSASVAWNLVAGQPFAERVDLDDFVFDMHARDFCECSFIGHRYRVPIDVVKDSALYTNARLSLEPSFDAAFNVQGDERISMLGRSYYGQGTEEFEDMIDLWEVYLPRHRLVVTLVDSSLSGPMGAGVTGPNSTPGPLRVQKWLGSDGGPYHFLQYGTVPGNAMPKAPIQDLVDLHDATNRMYRKAIRQGERQKEILAVAGGAMEDGNRVMQASDGDIIRVDNPERSQTRVFGGHNQQNLALGTHLKDVFGWIAGNLDMMGGLAPQSKTLGQDQMLAQNASRAVADMQDTTVDYTADVLKSLCWYWWHDPFKVMKTKAQLPGLPDMGIQRQVTPQQRMRGRFEELEIEIDPYSMQHSTPQSRLAALNQIVQGIITPMMQFLQQQGVSFDVNAYLQKVAAYADMPDLVDIVTIQEPPHPDLQASGGAPPEAPKPAETTRNYVRHSAGADNQQSRGADFMNQLAAGANQPNGQPQGQQR